MSTNNACFRVGLHHVLKATSQHFIHCITCVALNDKTMFLYELISKAHSFIHAIIYLFVCYSHHLFHITYLIFSSMWGWVLIHKETHWQCMCYCKQVCGYEYQPYIQWSTFNHIRNCFPQVVIRFNTHKPLGLHWATLPTELHTHTLSLSW